ncbi:hypothetical protein HZ992_16660 [Rhizobacter sp. AJA081-3]|uniref:hypothetical protein n=1 Tax=Rhizobacter sp. AJA081-3 TaxID=2753607 RepID=UPI001AE03C98|nr:hypothetical protein [Rhizobacter sp. AJA081-3]QTN21797.1 hypothetical protein HZ992_16660 [Rhizobacter sp. AJA081-3]
MRRFQAWLMSRWPEAVVSHGSILVVVALLFMLATLARAWWGPYLLPELTARLGEFGAQMLTGLVLLGAWLLLPRPYDFALRHGRRNLRVEYADLAFCATGVAMLLMAPFLAWQLTAWKVSNEISLNSLRADVNVLREAWELRQSPPMLDRNNSPWDSTHFELLSKAYPSSALDQQNDQRLERLLDTASLFDALEQLRARYKSAHSDERSATSCSTAVAHAVTISRALADPWMPGAVLPAGAHMERFFFGDDADQEAERAIQSFLDRNGVPVVGRSLFFGRGGYREKTDALWSKPTDCLEVSGPMTVLVLALQYHGSILHPATHHGVQLIIGLIGASSLAAVYLLRSQVRTASLVLALMFAAIAALREPLAVLGTLAVLSMLAAGRARVSPIRFRQFRKRWRSDLRWLLIAPIIVGLAVVSTYYSEWSFVDNQISWQPRIRMYAFAAAMAAYVLALPLLRQAYDKARSIPS